MRDVIIIGAGGGGPIVAKELAARGLDVLLLEAGPVLPGPRARVDSVRERRQQRARRLLPLRPGRPVASRPGSGRRRRTRSSGSSPASAARPSTTTATTRGRSRARSSATTAPTRRTTTPQHLFPFTYQRAHPVLRVGRGHAAGADGGHGHEGGDLPPRRRAARPALPDRARTRTQASYRPQENAILQPGGTAGKTADADRPHVPGGHRLHVLRLLLPGLLRAAARAAQPEGQALHRQQLRADGAHGRQVDAGRQGRHAHHRCLRHAHQHQRSKAAAPSPSPSPGGSAPPASTTPRRPRSS